jgi:hypothetical protein
MCAINEMFPAYLTDKYNYLDSFNISLVHSEANFYISLEHAI